MIPFNVPPCVGTEMQYLEEAVRSHKIGETVSVTLMRGAE